MANISPVSDLRNYNTILDKVSVGSPVHLLRLMCELNEGRCSGEEEGYISSEDVRAYFRGKRP